MCIVYMKAEAAHAKPWARQGPSRIQITLDVACQRQAFQQEAAAVSRGRVGTHVEQVLALEGERVEGGQRPHDLLDEHVAAGRQLVQRGRGVCVACTQHAKRARH